MRPSITFIFLVGLGVVPVISGSALRTEVNEVEPSEKRNAILYGNLNYLRPAAAAAASGQDHTSTRDVTPYRNPPPATIEELFRAIIKAVRDWFSDVIKQILGITPEELIKQINACLLGLEELIESAAVELQRVVDQVDGEPRKLLQIIINCILHGAVDMLEPMQEQMRQILLYLPETNSGPLEPSPIQTRDIVSDIIEALLGISLEELLTNINNLFVFFNEFLLETISMLNAIANEVPQEIAAEIEAIINQILFEAQHELLRPLLNSLGQLPIDTSVDNKYFGLELIKNVKTRCELF